MRVDNIKTALKQYDYQSTCGAKNMFQSINMAAGLDSVICKGIDLEKGL